MPDMNDEIMSMPKGWVVYYRDGSIITEYDVNGVQREWRKVPKVNIKAVGLKWNSKFWCIHGKEHYIQKKRGWVPVSFSGASAETTVQYRYIGYWEGKNKVFYRVDENTGQMTIITEQSEGRA